VEEGVLAPDLNGIQEDPRTHIVCLYPQQVLRIFIELITLNWSCTISSKRIERQYTLSIVNNHLSALILRLLFQLFAVEIAVVDEQISEF
jgi:hypothetical protein